MRVVAAENVFPNQVHAMQLMMNRYHGVVLSVQALCICYRMSSFEQVLIIDKDQRHSEAVSNGISCEQY